ncbi:MAG TPA: hypothetical protein VJZ94_02565, partial [Candidatus Paceibacterota bacterium]|nr:hypothetical protein [Candidatus Paceibacterota bacterium]
TGRTEILVKKIVNGINRRVLDRHDWWAKCAIWKLFDLIYVAPLHPLFGLAALQQICRDDLLEFTVEEDEELIARISKGSYFLLHRVLDLTVETQEGVV